jgi:hypothetical protein
MGERLGAAEVQYGDLRGTVAIDGPDDREELYELAGLSRDDWSIAYDIGGTYDSTWASVWAVPRDVTYEDWERMAREGRETAEARRFDFQLEDDAAAFTLLKQNKRWSIHALHRSLVNLGLDVETSD